MEMYFTPRMRSRSIVGHPEVCKVSFRTSKDHWYGLETELHGNQKLVLTTGRMAKDGMESHGYGTVMYRSLLDVFGNAATFCEFARDFAFEVFQHGFEKSKFRRLVDEGDRYEMRAFLDDAMRRIQLADKSMGEEECTPERRLRVVASFFENANCFVQMNADYLQYEQGKYYQLIWRGIHTVMLDDGNGSVASLPVDLVEA